VLSTLILPHPLRAQLVAEARAAFPHECCGLIEGTQEGEKVRAVVLHPTANFSAAPDGFEIDPSAHIRLLRTLRGTGRGIVGCYHSHPNGRPEPSERDRASGGEEGFVWLIAALADGAGPLELVAFEATSFRPLLLAG